MGAVSSFIGDFLNNIYRPNVEFSDIAEILIIAFFLYHIILWMKTSRAWTLLKGILVIIIFALIAYLCKFTTILWIAGKTINVALIAVVVIFQPELRKALEQLGNKRYLAGLLQFDDLKDKKEIFSDRTIDELVKASYEMAKHKTGALIVIEQEINLQDYINTGIDIDAFVSNQLLINIFEHNTPLHDGAVIIRGNRIVSATCYLPLSDNMDLSKELGTRHRAGAGISEATDAFVIIVSEETGKVSIAHNGQLVRNVDGEYLRNKLELLKIGNLDMGKRIKIWKRGGRSDEENNIQ
ncbi:MAG TPA: TIGR00159 family protein [Eubacterium sp.]|nr:TIGR00159 family protein [Eubacterium sp.]